MEDDLECLQTVCRVHCIVLCGMLRRLHQNGINVKQERLQIQKCQCLRHTNLLKGETGSMLLAQVL